jgi:hypothetical protein
LLLSGTAGSPVFVEKSAGAGMSYRPAPGTGGVLRNRRRGGTLIPPASFAALLLAGGSGLGSVPYGWAPRVTLVVVDFPLRT